MKKLITYFVGIVVGVTGYLLLPDYKTFIGVVLVVAGSEIIGIASNNDRCSDGF